ncbi:hypothetical protein DV737_g839, partial [Chaetothyriales sp. CBS 132003]
MGISGLLPLLKSIQKPCSLKNFKGQTIGVDAYGWLHRGTVACAIELALDKPTLKYAEFAINRVKMLQAFGVTPYLIFDGDALPSKAGTNAERRKKRHESKTLGLELYKAGKVSQAHQELQKAAEVTYEMARQLIEDLKKLDIQYIVAPYEADAQLVYLEQKGIIDGILSEDSDMLVYGAKRLITKLDQYGNCIMIDRADFALCKDISLTGWTDAMFRRMAILSGCDYLPNINKMGLKTAYRFVRKHKEAQRTIRMIALEGKLTVPVDYPERFRQAELTFLHHRVFCPLRQQMVYMNELPRGLKAEDMPYLGPYIEPDTVIGVACGDLNPRTKEALFPKSASTHIALAENRQQVPPAGKSLKSSKSIESFFAPKRQPLAELNPNSLTPSPSQQRLLERHRNASWSAREVSSAPQPRRTVANIPPPSLGTDRGAFLARAAKVSEFQAPKRQRLCPDMPGGCISKEIEQSHFFTSRAPQTSPLVEKKMRNKKARIGEFDVFSDGSVDDALLGLPGVQHAASPAAVWDQDLPPCRSDDDGKSASLVDSIPQSSPPGDTSSGDGGSHAAKATSFGNGDEGADDDVVVVEDSDKDTELEPFEDLLESHIRMQKTGQLTSFGYQSPSRSIDSQRSRSAPTKRRDYSTTFFAQSATKQRMALSSLPKVGNVEDGGEKSMRASKSTAPPDTPSGISRPNRAAAGVQSGLTSKQPRSASPVLQTGGSEDALIPASDDEVSDADTVRFQTGWRRFVPAIGYHHVLMIFIAIAIVLLSLLLAGCSSTSPFIPDIYLISLYYHQYAPIFSPTQVDPGVTTAIVNIVGSANLNVRVGYFGICITSEGSGWMCNTNSTALADLVSVDQDPLNLVWVASTFKNAIVFPYLLIIAIVLAFLTFLLLATFPGWHTATSSDGSEHEE